MVKEEYEEEGKMQEEMEGTEVEEVVVVMFKEVRYDRRKKKKLEEQEIK